MLDDVTLQKALASAFEIEYLVRDHLEAAHDGANEAACSQAAYRNVVGLRKALQDWTVVRDWRARRQRTTA